MKTYQELRDNFFEEVGKIDVSKLLLTSFGGGLKDYAELLKIMSELPKENTYEKYKEGLSLGFGGSPVPKIEEGGN